MLSLIRASNFKYLILGLFLGGSLFASEKYSATVNDGTPRLVEHSTRMDDGGETIVTNLENSRNLRQRSLKKKAIEAPQTFRTRTHSAVDAEIADLRKQSDSLQHRLEILEDARTEVEKNPPSLDSDEYQEFNANELSDTPQPEPMLPVESEKPTVVAAPQPAQKAKLYDKVPDNRVAELAERLKYTNDILKRFGLAFDYRATTLKELKTVLATLENKQEQNAPRSKTSKNE